MTKPLEYYAYNLKRRVYDGCVTGHVTTSLALGYMGSKDRKCEKVLIDKDDYNLLKKRLSKIKECCAGKEDPIAKLIFGMCDL